MLSSGLARTSELVLEDVADEDVGVVRLVFGKSNDEQVEQSQSEQRRWRNVSGA